jgi:Transglutaminase-like superfamily
MAMTGLAKFRALPARERGMVLRAITTLWRVWFALRIANFARVRALANGPAIGNASPDSPTADRIAWAIAAASPFVSGGSNCLLRAIAAGIMLRQYGFESALQIGVAKSPNGTLTAHAWLESAGKVVIGDFELDRYVTLDTHRPAAA